MAYGLYLCKSMHFRAVITPLNQSNWLILFHMSLYQRHSRFPPTLTCQGCCGPDTPGLTGRLLQIRLIEGRQVTGVLVIHWRGFLLHSQNFRKKTRKKSQRFAGKKTAVVSFESQNWVLKDLVVKLCSGPILPSLKKQHTGWAGENNLPVGFWKKNSKKKKHHTCTMSLLIKCSPSHHQQCKGKSNFGAPACLNLYLRRVTRHGSGRKGQTQTKTLL